MLSILHALAQTAGCLSLVCYLCIYGIDNLHVLTAGSMHQPNKALMQKGYKIGLILLLVAT